VPRRMLWLIYCLFSAEGQFGGSITYDVEPGRSARSAAVTFA